MSSIKSLVGKIENAGFELSSIVRVGFGKYRVCIRSRGVNARGFSDTWSYDAADPDQALYIALESAVNSNKKSSVDDLI